MEKDKGEFRNFDSTMRKLVSVPHSEIKAELDADRNLGTDGRNSGTRDVPRIIVQTSGSFATAAARN